MGTDSADREIFCALRQDLDRVRAGAAGDLAAARAELAGQVAELSGQVAELAAGRAELCGQVAELEAARRSLEFVARTFYFLGETETGKAAVPDGRRMAAIAGGRAGPAPGMPPPSQRPGLRLAAPPAAPAVLSRRRAACWRAAVIALAVLVAVLWLTEIIGG